jgi:hypothetical protein
LKANFFDLGSRISEKQKSTDELEELESKIELEPESEFNFQKRFNLLDFGNMFTARDRKKI